MEKIKIVKGSDKKYIDPKLHGQFIEFLGNCISEGIWVGTDADIPHYEGLRKDVVDALKALQPPLVRWPGGCYADMYHWRDGIGSKAERKTTWNENFGTYEAEKNEFGTHEFIRFCELVGAEPWLNVNMLRGSVAEMVEWAEYCNRKEPTTLSKEREKNGSQEPFNVEYWGLGNECWAGGGNYTAMSYADEYRKYASALPSFKPSDPFHPVEGIDMKMIACGPDGNKPKERVNWTKDFFKSLGQYRTPRIDGYDIHFYNWNLKNQPEKETEFDEHEWYQVLSGCLELEEVIKEQYDLVQEGLKNLPEAEGDFPASPADCKLIVGEWGNWHWSAFTNRPALYQQCTMRDALTTALTLDIFHRNADIVSMACVAQTVNVLNSLILTKGEHTILTPNYYVFQMYMVHRGGIAAETAVEGTASYEAEGQTLNNICSFASVKDGVLSVNIINTNMTQEMEVLVIAAEHAQPLSGSVLAAETPDMYNDEEHPDQIMIREAALPVLDENGEWKVTVPAASVSVYQFRTER